MVPPGTTNVESPFDERSPRLHTIADASEETHLIGGCQTELHTGTDNLWPSARPCRRAVV